MAKNKENKGFYITGKSFYSMTTRKETSGRYPSNAYNVGVTDIEIDDDNHEIVEKYLKTTKDSKGNEVENISIKNAKYQIPMFDMNNAKMADVVAIPNGTSITLYVEEKYNMDFDKNYLVCKAIRVNEEVKPFNPFA